MIRFYCEHCAHKISVRDSDIGRQGKCSNCGKIVIVPTESTVIDFLCEYCDRVISIPKSHTGKKMLCPKCRNMFIIPAIHAPGSDANQDYSGDLIDRTTDSTHGLTLIDVPEEYKLKEEPPVQPSIPKPTIEPQQETETDGHRNLPWFIDIFLYPISKGGLSTIGIILLLRIITDLAAAGLLIFCLCIGGILGFVIKIVVYYSYIYWYFTECVRDSAHGGLRAPVILASMPGFGDMVRYFFRIFSCYAITLGPVTFYRGYTYFTGIETNYVILFALLTYGMVFFPMGILAVVMFDSVYGLKPALLVRSIASTLFHYCGLVILFYGLGILFAGLYSRIRIVSVRGGFFSWFLLVYVLSNILLLYSLLISGHLLGRFFYLYEDKLYWEV
jgi:hypothetical protein